MQDEQIEYVDINAIETEEQVRDEITDASTDGLTDTFVEHGQMQPIRLRRDGQRFVVVDGHRRLKCGQRAGHQKIAAIVEVLPLTDAEVTLRQLVCNLHEPLQPLEKANAFQRLIGLMRWSPGEVAKRSGQSPASVSRSLALLTLPEAIRKQISAGQISASSGYKLSQIKDAAQQAELAQRITQEGLTRQGVEHAVKTKRVRKAKASPRRRTSTIVAPLADRQTLTIRGPLVDLASLISLLDEFVAKAKSALAESSDLKTFLASLKNKPTT